MAQALLLAVLISPFDRRNGAIGRFLLLLSSWRGYVPLNRLRHLSSFLTLMESSAPVISLNMCSPMTLTKCIGSTGVFMCLSWYGSFRSAVDPVQPVCCVHSTQSLMVSFDRRVTFAASTNCWVFSVGALSTHTCLCGNRSWSERRGSWGGRKRLCSRYTILFKALQYSPCTVCTSPCERKQ